MIYTPENIKTLDTNEIFVFGSNLFGMHGGGAAKLAADKFGAKQGMFFGLSGQSFAIPTKFNYHITMKPEEIKPFIEAFCVYAKYMQHLTFFVTKIGCGLARLEPKDLAQYFAEATYNVLLPKEFSDIIKGL